MGQRRSLAARRYKLYNSGDNLHPSDAGYAAMAATAFDVLNGLNGN